MNNNSEDARLLLVAGKAGSGKSTLAEQLAKRHRALLIGEDRWLKTLFGEEMHSLADYVRYAARLKAALLPHLIALLDAGNTLVLDFPMNTRSTRAWASKLARQAQVGAQLHLLEVADDVCLARINQRNAQGEHPFQLSAEQFQQLARYFEPPQEDEGLPIVRHNAED